jgi:ABC-type phosphate/phosphonate transport system substrate-binding protein
VTAGIAALPMYDRQELRPAIDGFWAAVRDGLRAQGVAAPDGLSREVGPMAGWTDPGLVLGQTCGLPFVRWLEGRVALLGALDYGIEGAPPGWYRSAVVARTDDPRRELAAFRGARLAANDRNSQSGLGAILHHAGPGFFGAIGFTGAHAASIRCVADGEADLAAIDSVSWRLAAAFLPAARRLRVLMLTAPTPGLPLIAARQADTARTSAAVAEGIARLDAEARAALGIRGFVPLAPADYRVIRDRAQAWQRADSAPA